MLKKIINKDNKRIIAQVYEKKDHNINAYLIDDDAKKIINKIKSMGGEAYVVGGAVRDLILGKKPKDFDIATSFTPNQLKTHFRNVRIIGHRFKLAHFYFQNNKIIEVATFRSLESKNNVNIYGSLEEDVLRRDFTINALYYDLVSQKIYDFVDGYPDLTQKKRLKEIINIDKIFKEDPVRIIRGIKYSIKDELTIGDELYQAMKKDANLIESISSSRLSEELFKIFGSGQTLEIIKELQKVGILNCILPKISYDVKIGNPILFANLSFFDTIVNNLKPQKNKIIEMGTYALIAHIYNKINTKNVNIKAIKQSIFTNLKVIFRHFNIPNVFLENAVDLLIHRTSILLNNDTNMEKFNE